MTVKRNSRLIVDEYISQTGERDTPELRKFTEALVRLDRAFYNAGRKVAKRGDPLVPVDFVRRYLEEKIGADEMAELDGLAELLHDAWTAGYREEVQE